MIWTWLFALTLPSHAGVPLVVKVDDTIDSVTLNCPDGLVETKAVENGRVTLDILPRDCTVSATSKLGKVNGAGEWTCTIRGCTLDVPPHKPVTDAEGRVNLIFLDYGNAKTIELSCSGYRERTAIDDYTAVFNDVPKGDCVVYAKGGSTAKSQPLTWGTYACTIAGPTLICQTYKK